MKFNFKDVNDTLEQKIRLFIKNENKNSIFLYNQIVTQNNLTKKYGDKSLKFMGNVFAAEKRKRLKEGNWFQIPSNSKFLDVFLKSDLGKRYYKEEIKKGKWLQVREEKKVHEKLEEKNKK